MGEQLPFKGRREVGRGGGGQQKIKNKKIPANLPDNGCLCFSLHKKLPHKSSSHYLRSHMDARLSGDFSLQSKQLVASFSFNHQFKRRKSYCSPLRSLGITSVSPPSLFVASVARFFSVVFFSLLFVSSVVVVVPQSESASFDFVAFARADVLPRWIPVRLGRDRNSQVQSGNLRIT